MIWPENVDGEVLRRMQKSGFDFSKPCLIDFDIDFEKWPPAREAITAIEREYPSAIVYEPTAEFSGYIEFQIYGCLTYELVTTTQTYVTALMKPYDGVCDCWGVLHGGQKK